MWEVIYENQKHEIVEAPDLTTLVCEHPDIIYAKEIS